MKWIVDEKLLELARDIMDRFRAHKSYCQIDETDFCTCGLKDHLQKYREELKKIKQIETLIP